MNFELEIIHWLQSIRNGFLDVFFNFFTLFGEEIILIVVLGFVYWCLNKKTGEKIGITIFVSLGLNSLIKLIVMRPRPFMVDSQIENLKPSTSGNYSFPSGHTQTTSTTFFSLYYFLKKRWLLIVAIIITTLVALSRMYLGVHYLTDVLMGALLGIIISYVAAKYLDSDKKIHLLYNVLFVLVNVAFVGIIVINYISNNHAQVLDSSQMFFDTESVAKMFGTIAGFILGVGYEKKYVNFSNHKDIAKNLLRLVLGLALIMGLRLGLKFLFGIIVDSDNLMPDEGFKTILAILLDYLRYLLMLFFGIGIFPKLFKKFHF